MKLLAMIFYCSILSRFVNSQYVTTIGGIVSLICNISDWSEDTISLMLWYKGNFGSPFFSLDAREVPLTQAILSTNDSRIHLNLTSPPSLIIEPVRWSDEGEYKCRVDYRNDRTQNIIFSLEVVVPPKNISILDSRGQKLTGLIGPYNEESNLVLICQSEGGQPSPNLIWWSGDNQLSGTEFQKSKNVIINKLIINKLNRSYLLMEITCTASFKKHHLLKSASVLLDLNLKPLNVHISISDDYLLVSRKSELKCLSFGSRPPAILTWWKSGQKIASSSESIDKNGNWTLSTLFFIPSFEDHNQEIVCKAENVHFKNNKIEHKFTFNIFYMPQMKVSLGARIQPDNIKEGIDVILECHLKANPAIFELTWTLNDDIITSNLSDGVLIANHSLVLQKIKRTHRGYYRCHAVNKAGKGKSEPFFLRVQYLPVCKPNRKKIYEFLPASQVKINCEVDADPEKVNFKWYINNSNAIYKIDNVTQNGTSSSIFYPPRNNFSFSSIYCTSSNLIGSQKNPCIFSVIPANVPEKVYNCSIKIHSTTSLNIDCKSSDKRSLDSVFLIEAYNFKTQQKLFEKSDYFKPSFFLENLDPDILYYFSIYSKTNLTKSEKVWLKTNLSPVISSSNQIKQEITDESKFYSLITLLITIFVILLIVGIIIAVIYKFRTYRVQNTESNECQRTTYKIDYNKDKNINLNKLTTIELEKYLSNGNFPCSDTNFDYYNLDRAFTNHIELKKNDPLTQSSLNCNKLEKKLIQFSSNFKKRSPIHKLFTDNKLKTNQVEKIALDTFNQLLANPKQLEPNCYPNFDEMSNSNFVKNLKISCDGNEVTISLKIPAVQLTNQNPVANNKTTLV